MSYLYLSRFYKKLIVWIELRLKYLLMLPVSYHQLALMIPGNLKSHYDDFSAHISDGNTKSMPNTGNPPIVTNAIFAFRLCKHWLLFPSCYEGVYGNRLFTFRLVCKADSGGYTMKWRSVKPKPCEFLWSTSVRGPCQDTPLPSAPPPRTGRGLSLDDGSPSLLPFV